MPTKFTFKDYIRTLGCYPTVINAISEATLSMLEINVDARTDKNGDVQEKLDGIENNLEDIERHTKKLFNLMCLAEHHIDNDERWDEDLNENFHNLVSSFYHQGK